MKTELEEAAEKQTEIEGWGVYDSCSEHYAIKSSFIAGAKWQAKRMHSEEEVLDILDAYLHFLTIDTDETAEEWFEQFKKKT